MKERFLKLYDYILNSENNEKMHVLGNMLKSMMDNLINTNPQLAQDYIDMLESVKWHNYLTGKEADSIVASMVPKPLWTKQVWEQTMTSLELDVEDPPYYNKCALFVTMSMICSDSGETIANIMGLQFNSQIAANTDFVKAVYHLALDKLKDKDHMFNIRSYFKL